MKKSVPVLMTHRAVAAKFGVSTRQWRRWVDEGRVPVPHSAIGTILFYDQAVIDYRLVTGLWPAGVSFRGRAARCDASALT